MRRNVNFSRWMTGVLAVVLIAGAPAALQAQEPAAAEAPAAQEAKQAQVDQQAQQVLDRVCGFYRRVDNVKVSASMNIKMQDQPDSPAMNLPMAAARPNKFAVPAGEGPEEYKLVSTGEKLYQFIGAPLNKYSEEPAPADFEALSKAGMFAESGMGTDLASIATAPHLILMHLMEGKTLAGLEGVSKVEFVGTEQLEDTPHDHLRLVGEEADVDVWFRSGEEPWLAQVKPDLTKTFDQFGEMGEGLKAQMPSVTLAFKDWEQKAELPPETFTFEPPEDAEKVDSLMAALREEMGGGADESRVHAQLLGKPAPALDLDLLSGGKAELGTHKGKVIVLDFWASWCGPCVKALPTMVKVTDKFKDQGVVLLAVNVQEDPDTIRKFLEKRKLSLEVPLDSDGEASERYGVTGIPQTVLIGKDGTVQAVHVGAGPDLEARLTGELEKLVKGEKLHKE